MRAVAVERSLLRSYGGTDEVPAALLQEFLLGKLEVADGMTDGLAVASAIRASFVVETRRRFLGAWSAGACAAVWQGVVGSLYIIYAYVYCVYIYIYIYVFIYCLFIYLCILLLSSLSSSV